MNCLWNSCNWEAVKGTFPAKQPTSSKIKKKNRLKVGGFVNRTSTSVWRPWAHNIAPHIFFGPTTAASSIISSLFQKVGMRRRRHEHGPFIRVRNFTGLHLQIQKLSVFSLFHIFSLCPNPIPNNKMCKGYLDRAKAEKLLFCFPRLQRRFKIC